MEVNYVLKDTVYYIHCILAGGGGILPTEKP